MVRQMCSSEYAIWALANRIHKKVWLFTLVHLLMCSMNIIHDSCKLLSDLSSHMILASCGSL